MNEPSDTSQDQSQPGRREGDRGFGVSVDVLERMRRGDNGALTAFFNEYFDMVYGLAFRLLGNRESVEDVTQEVFLRVHRSAPSLDPHRDPRPWLSTITINLCRDRWRSFEARIERRSVSADDADPKARPLVSDTPAADSGLLANERERIVQSAIMKLPADLREVVVLRDYEGLDHQAIAEIVGASHDAVRKRYSRALSQLGELLEDELL
jgi:RNA polymerase sigma-70 factor (ECF subfamily)